MLSKIKRNCLEKQKYVKIYKLFNKLNFILNNSIEKVKFI